MAAATASALRAGSEARRRTTLDALDRRACASDGPRALLVGRSQAVLAPGARQQLVEPALVDDRAPADDRDAVTELLDLGEDVAREQDRDPVARRAASRARACRACRPGRGRSSARRAAAAAGRAAAKPRSRAAAACRASSRRRGPSRGRAARRASSTSSMRAAAPRRRGRRAGAGSCGRRGTGRSAAPRRSPRRRREPGRRRRCGSRPNSRAAPSVGRISPSSIRSEVVLPAPFGPR